MDNEEVLTLGRTLGRLVGSKDFQEAILEEFIVQGRLRVTQGFTGTVDEVEALKAIAFFESWYLQSMEDAKILIKES
jgi:hypothetical protein